jgi:hypothetical protein
VVEVKRRLSGTPAAGPDGDAELTAGPDARSAADALVAAAPVSSVVDVVEPHADDTVKTTAAVNVTAILGKDTGVSRRIVDVL